jgi:hypothetical protein
MEFIMSTLPPPSTKKFAGDSLESKAYKIAEDLKDYLPVMNDRNRLGYNLFKFMRGEGDKPEILIKTLKLKIENISQETLTEMIKKELQRIKD